MIVSTKLISILRQPHRNISTTTSVLVRKNILQYVFEGGVDQREKTRIRNIGNDDKILFSTHLNRHAIPMSRKYKQISQIEDKGATSIVNNIPLCMQNSLVEIPVGKIHINQIPEDATPTENAKIMELADNSYPYQQFDSFKYDTKMPQYFKSDDTINTVENEINERVKLYEQNKLTPRNVIQKKKDNPLYDNSHITDIEFLELQKIGYGIPDPSIAISHINCRGCGALFHCQSDTLPGYIPSEAFINTTNREKTKLLCQRCYFLKHHNMALNIRVQPSEFEKVLQPIKEGLCLVLVVVDMFDIPCSIWPGIGRLLGRRRPVIVIGNKVDLLPPDGPDHLLYVEKTLKECIRQTSLGKTNVKFTTLVSAKTGYGIEELVSSIHKTWGTKGNIFITGTTNSGKSTLFNALLGSDLCQTPASMLLNRATSSVWPGTTLNLLKFPLKYMTKEKVMVRRQRLEQDSKCNYYHNIRSTHITSGYTRDFAAATLKAYIGHTHNNPLVKNKIAAPITERQALARWREPGIHAKCCYDTPGTVQSDQIITLLTHDELVKTVPTTILEPRTYALQKGCTLFVGGIARLDIVYAQSSVRLTVFSSTDLPITIVHTVDAAEVYRNYLQSGIFGVPSGTAERFEQWPALKARNFFVTGLGPDQCCCDIVLASCAFISPSAAYSADIDIRAWTPGGRGMYLRKNAILPRTAGLRGDKRLGGFAYGSHTTYMPEHEKDNVHHIVHGSQFN